MSAEDSKKVEVKVADAAPAAKDVPEEKVDLVSNVGMRANLSSHFVAAALCISIELI